MRERRRWESSQNIFEIFEGIDVETFARFNQAHERRCRFCAILGAREQPVPPAQDKRFNTALTAVVGNLHVAVLEVDEKRLPPIECVRNRVSEFSFRWLYILPFVEPDLEAFDFRLGEPLTNISSSLARERFSCALDVKETFDHAHRKLRANRIDGPGVFKVAMNVRPTVGRGSASSDDLVEFISSIGLQYAGVTIEDSFRIFGVLGVRIVVKNVGMLRISSIHPGEATVRFPEILFDHGESGGIGLNDVAVANEFKHAIDDWREQIRNLSQPSTHGCSINWNVQRFKNLLLTVQRKMQPKFVGGDLCEKTGSGRTFIYRLIRFLADHDVLVAFLTSIFEHSVLYVFENTFHKFNLSGGLKTDDRSSRPAVRARQLTFVHEVLDCASGQSWRWSGATASVFLLRDNLKSLYFIVKFRCGLLVNYFSRAGKQGSIDLSGLLPEHSTTFPTDLLFQFSNSSEQFPNEVVACRDVVRKFLRWVEGAFDWWFLHFEFDRRLYYYILQYTPDVVSNLFDEEYVT